MSPLERYRYIRDLRMPSSPKLVLLILASHADRDGLCWPGRALLAAETGLSVRTVVYTLAWLAAHGLLIRRPRLGRSSTYLLTLEAFQLASTRATIARVGVQPLHPEVAHKKVRARQPTPYYSHCIHCGRSVKVAQAHTQGICASCSRARNHTPSADVIALFPEAHL